MPEYSVENHLPHAANTVPAPYFDGFEPKRWEGRKYVPRSAEETVAVLGLVRVLNIEIPVVQRRFTELIQDEGIPYNPNVLKIVSYETIAAAHRSGRPIDDLAYPYGILRDDTGRILGCRGFGMPQPVTDAPVSPLAITPADVARLGDPEEWVNTANYPMRLYDPAAFIPGTDLINSDLHDPIVDIALPSAPLDLTPDVQIDESRSAQFGVPIYKVRPNKGADAIKHLPEGRKTLHLLHPLALRHAALLGCSVWLCGVIGGLGRNSKTGTVLGGTAIYAFDPAMIAADGM